VWDFDEPPLNLRPLPTQFFSYLTIGFDANLQYLAEIDRASSNSGSTHWSIIVQGISQIFVRPYKTFTNDVEIFVDGKNIDVPEGIRSLKLVNIKSAACGVYYWGNGSNDGYDVCTDFTPPTSRDGKLEVMSSFGVLHHTGCRMKMRHATRLGQGKAVSWKIKTEVHVQIDGESFLIPPCTIHVSRKDRVPFIYNY